MIVLVLLHKGKGGGLSDLFGGGVSSSLGGSSVVERNLDRLTIGMAIIWIASIGALGLLLKTWPGPSRRPTTYTDAAGAEPPVRIALEKLGSSTWQVVTRS